MIQKVLDYVYLKIQFQHSFDLFLPVTFSSNLKKVEPHENPQAFDFLKFLFVRYTLKLKLNTFLQKSSSQIQWLFWLTGKQICHSQVLFHRFLNGDRVKESLWFIFWLFHDLQWFLSFIENIMKWVFLNS